MRLLSVLLLLTLPVVAKAQSYTDNYGTWDYTNDNGTISITGYTGPGGSATIPSYIGWVPVTGIAAAAFFACFGFTDITIPNSFTSIGYRAFELCVSLTNVMIGSGVLQIVPGAFYSCNSLTTINVDTSNAFYSSMNGVLFDKGRATLVEYPGGLSGNYTIPATVSTIGAYSFADCNGLTGITIPVSVTNIETDAFDGCPALTQIIIPSGVNSIGYAAFAECQNLTNATLASGVNGLGIYVFSFGSLATISMPASVTSIGDRDFYSCVDLASITIPASVTNIGSQAFLGCSNLATVYFKGNAPSADSSVFDFNNITTVYYLPGTTGWSNTFGGRPTVLWNPQIQAGSFGIKSNQFSFNITGSSNLVVVIEASTNLANPTWYPLQTNSLNGNPLYFTDPQWTNYGSRFYRVSWP